MLLGKCASVYFAMAENVGSSIDDVCQAIGCYDVIVVKSK